MVVAALTALFLCLSYANAALLHSSAPVPGFFLTIIFATWYGGLGAGLATSGLSLLILGYVFLAGADPNSYPAHVGHLSFVALIAACVIWIVVSERRSAAQLRFIGDELQRNNDALTRENREGKALEQTLRRSESELRLVIDTIPAMAWSLHPDGRLEFLNRRWLEYTGMTLASALGEANSVMHPDDARKAFELWHEAMETGKGYDQEIRLRREDGTYRCFLVRTVPLLGGDGRIVRWYGTSTDIEDRKRAEDRLQYLSRRLLEAHEEERRHFSRELHDEFGQLLATIGFYVQAARTTAGENAQPNLEAAMAVLERAGKEVRNLALELRPTMLETAGLDATLAWLARETEERTGIATRVVGSLGALPIEPAMALFRVVQQAVSNSVRHANPAHIWIELAQGDSRLELVIRDDGRGFDVARALDVAPASGRLGILGMTERLQILGGQLSIDSRQGAGTRVSIVLREPALDAARA